MLTAVCKCVQRKHVRRQRGAARWVDLGGLVWNAAPPPCAYLGGAGRWHLLSPNGGVDVFIVWGVCCYGVGVGVWESVIYVVVL